MALAHPWRREDILAALDCLAARPPRLGPGERDRRWPAVGDAINWLIDDTWWDQRPASDDIGTFLRDAAEADACAAVVDLICRMIEASPFDDEATMFADPRWRDVMTLAARAAELMRRPDR